MDNTETSESTCMNFDALRQRTEDYVRDEPTKAVGIALAAGMLFTIVPVFRIVGGLLRVAILLAKPAIVIFGAMKVYEQYQKRDDAE